jgi:DNA (cytosine-5)-methyltransferase 1
MSLPIKPLALEFFAGGGLARLGLAADFNVVWANDIDPKKAQSWCANFGSAGFHLGDINAVDPASLPRADLAWASFPCQDLSLAGSRAGLGAVRSGTFFGFVEVIKGLRKLKRAPKILVIENVSGLLTSHAGQDFARVMQALSDLGYQAGALEIDAKHFVPQSRSRVFIVAYEVGKSIPTNLQTQGPHASPTTSPALVKAWRALPSDLRIQHIWWALRVPENSTETLANIIDTTDHEWWSQSKTAALVDSFSARHRAMLADVQAAGVPQIGAVYRRTRTVNGVSRPFAEVRFDGLAGCLRTPSGGSSRQFLLFVHGDSLAVRSLNPREALRLMGVSDNYVLPNNTLAGLKVAGDGVVVPVVSWLSQHLLAPLAALKP